MNPNWVTIRIKMIPFHRKSWEIDVDLLISIAIELQHIQVHSDFHSGMEFNTRYGMKMSTQNRVNVGEDLIPN